MSLAAVMSLLLLTNSLSGSQPSPSCNLSIYSVDETGERGALIISPADVASIDYGGATARTGDKGWFVVLTEDGSAKAAIFTKSHIGKQMSVTCDGKEIERAAIAGEFSHRFEVVPREPN
jgi:hypothetical protein